MSPFDIATALVKTKDGIYETEGQFQKDYNPFMVNRILSNSQKTVLYGDVINQCPHIDKKLQHDFYLYAIPKQSTRLGWSKKESVDIDTGVLEFVQSQYGTNQKRSLEIIGIVGVDNIREHMKFGGK